MPPGSKPRKVLEESNGVWSPDSSHTLSEMLRSKRLSLGLTYAVVATEIGISRGWAYQIEKYKFNVERIPKHTVERLAEWLKLDPGLAFLMAGYMPAVPLKRAKQIWDLLIF